MDSVLSWFILLVIANIGFFKLAKCVLNAKANREEEYQYESALEQQFNAIRVNEWREFN